MNRLIRPSTALRTITLCSVGALFLLAGCESNDDSVDHTPPDHYRLLTQVGEKTKHLKIDYFDPSLGVLVSDAELTDTFDHEAGWVFRGETSYKLSSINRALGGTSRLAVPEDGASLTPILADSGLNNSSVLWQFVAMPEGGCIIYNELLGSELALTVNTGTEPVSVEMMSIDADMEGQRWRLDPYGNVDLTLSELCL